MADQPPLPCPAWLWSNNSDVHVAKDRSWFGDGYTPFETFVQDMFGGSVPVVGIGSVDLPTKTSPTMTGPSSHGTVRLRNVLHAPGILSYFKPFTPGVRFFEVQLSEPPTGPRVGPSPFDPSGHYMIHAFWPDSERQRFAALRASRPSQATPSGPLTQAEKGWIKKHFGNEFKFLRAYGLSIYKDEDREEGRAIVRALMSHDDDRDSAS